MFDKVLNYASELRKDYFLAFNERFQRKMQVIKNDLECYFRETKERLRKTFSKTIFENLRVFANLNKSLIPTLFMFFAISSTF